MAAKHDTLPKITTNPELVRSLRDIAKRFPVLYHCPFPESWPKVLLKQIPLNSLIYETFSESHLAYAQRKPDGTLRAQTATIYHITPSEDDFYIRPIMAVETEYLFDPEISQVFGSDSGKIFHEMVVSRHTVNVPMTPWKFFLESICDHILHNEPIETIKFDTQKQSVTIIKPRSEN